MSSELKRIARIRDIRAHRERAAQRALASAQIARMDAEREGVLANERFSIAADRASTNELTSSDDFALERAHVHSLGRQVIVAETKILETKSHVDERLQAISMAHREVEKIDRWSDIAREAARAEATRIERTADDEVAARKIRA